MKGFISFACTLLYTQSSYSTLISNTITKSGEVQVLTRSSKDQKQTPSWLQVPWDIGSWFSKNDKEPGHDKTEAVEEDEEEGLYQYLQAQTNYLPKTCYGHSKTKSSCVPPMSSLTIPNKFLDILAKHGQKDIQYLGRFTTDPLLVASHISVTTHIALRSWKLSAYAIRYNDPYWRKQWYVQDYRTKSGPVMDLNVVPVYDMGIAGKGVIVAIVSNGIIHDHPDLKGILDVSMSYDFCLNKPGCEPVLVKGKKATHGTNCAGVVAMDAGNYICGVGIAHKAKVIGINVICLPKITHDILFKALTHKLERVDIYSNSWGPADDPKMVYVLPKLLSDAYTTGVINGRKGKGAIYVHSSGSGGHLGDNCALDGFINTPEVIVIGSVNQYGKKSDFSESCTAVFAVTYSGSSYTGFIAANEGIVAPSSDKGCTNSVSKSAAATSIASGIIALVLEANPDLTYRDVMHIIAMTAEVAPLADNPHTWTANGRRLWVSNDFGFGLLNAKNMVKLAHKNIWKTVPEKHTCLITYDLIEPVKISCFEKAIIPFTTGACESYPTAAVRYLEHIEVASKITYTKRGSIGIYIVSPSGVRTKLLDYRRKDESHETLNGTSFMSVQQWGEDPRGNWNIDVIIDPLLDKCKPELIGYVYGFHIKLHGTYDMPDHYNRPRIYASFRTANGDECVAA